MEWRDWYIIAGVYYNYDRTLFWWKGETYYQMKLYRSHELIAVFTCKDDRPF